MGEGARIAIPFLLLPTGDSFDADSTHSPRTQTLYRYLEGYCATGISYADLARRCCCKIGLVVRMPVPAFWLPSGHDGEDQTE